MTYRDDGDALLARVDALDAEAERLREERDAAVRERDAAVAERDAAVAERDAVRAAVPTPTPTPTPTPEPASQPPPAPSPTKRKPARDESSATPIWGWFMRVVCAAAYVLAASDLALVAATGAGWVPPFVLFPGFLVVTMFTIPGKSERGALDDMPRWTVAPMIAHAVFWIVSLAAWKTVAAHATALAFLAPAVLISIYRRW